MFDYRKLGCGTQSNPAWGGTQPNLPKTGLFGQAPFKSLYVFTAFPEN